MTIEEKLKNPTIQGFLIIGTMINSDKILNRASGRTEVFENMVATNASLKLEKEINANFSKKIMSESFGLPEINNNGFITYCMTQ